MMKQSNLDQESRGLERWIGMIWVCFLTIILLAAATMVWRGFDWLTVLIICIALVCPAVILWTALLGRSMRKGGRR